MITLELKILDNWKEFEEMENGHGLKSALRDTHMFHLNESFNEVNEKKSLFWQVHEPIVKFFYFKSIAPIELNSETSAPNFLYI